jgi:hypothetical protein
LWLGLFVLFVFSVFCVCFAVTKAQADLMIRAIHHQRAMRDFNISEVFVYFLFGLL